jgi:hypothetical protein
LVAFRGGFPGGAGVNQKRPTIAQQRAQHQAASEARTNELLELLRDLLLQRELGNVDENLADRFYALIMRDLQREPAYRRSMQRLVRYSQVKQTPAAKLDTAYADAAKALAGTTAEAGVHMIEADYQAARKQHEQQIEHILGLVRDAENSPNSPTHIAILLARKKPSDLSE